VVSQRFYIPSLGSLFAACFSWIARARIFDFLSVTELPSHNKPKPQFTQQALMKATSQHQPSEIFWKTAAFFWIYGLKEWSSIEHFTGLVRFNSSTDNREETKHSCRSPVVWQWPKKNLGTTSTKQFIFTGQLSGDLLFHPSHPHKQTQPQTPLHYTFAVPPCLSRSLLLSLYVECQTKTVGLISVLTERESDRKRERETKRQRETDRQTDRERDRELEGQRDRHSDRHRDR
jgi:hypothetical protein